MQSNTENRDTRERRPETSPWLLRIGWLLTLAALALLFAALALKDVSDMHRLYYLSGLILLETGIVYYCGHHVVTWMNQRSNVLRRRS